MAAGLITTCGMSSFPISVNSSSLEPIFGGFNSYSQFISKKQENNSAIDVPPLELKIKADRQQYDANKNRYLAVGNVKISLGQAILKADLIEFDRNFKILFARGKVRFRKGDQFFQASSFKYNLIQKKGVLKNVYGILDLKTFNNKELTLNKSNFHNDLEDLDLKSNFLTSKQDQLLEIQKNIPSFNKRISNISLTSNFWREYLKSSIPPVTFIIDLDEGNTSKIACPPKLPFEKDWQPYSWAFNVWGGKMNKANLDRTLALNFKTREEDLFGIGLQKRIYRNGPFSFELEANFFKHSASSQAGGKYNQKQPFLKANAQNFWESILAIGARVWLRPWLSLGLFEGISYNSETSNFEKSFREKFSKTLNYLGFEIETKVSESLSLVGRVHHRSGAFGLFNGVKKGSNAYLLGFRYRWGRNQRNEKDIPISFGFHPSCRNLEKNKFSELEIETQSNPTTFRQKVNSINEDSIPKYDEYIHKKRELIDLIDQRVKNIYLRNRLSLKTRFGIESLARKLNDKNTYGGVKASQILLNRRSKLIEGSISRWRVQASKIYVNQNGWQASRMSFTNDPLTPTQTRIDSYNVIASEDKNGDIIVTTGKNQLILEEQVKIPIIRKYKFKKEEDVENRWVVGIDNKDRDGVFVGRKLKPVKLGENYELYLQPQFLLQRSINTSTNTYSSSEENTSQSENTRTRSSDLFGLKSELIGRSFGWDVALESDLTTFNSTRFSDHSRFWGSARKFINIPFLNKVQIVGFGAYRYRTWNGSIGETDIYSAYGSYLQKIGEFDFGKISSNFLLRAGIGNYQPKKFTSNGISSLWRTGFYGSLNSKLSIWKSKKKKNSSLYSIYRYSSKPIRSQLFLNSNIQTAYNIYSNDSYQSIARFSAGPTLILGELNKSFLDYTKIEISAGKAIKSGVSPFDFDKAVDLMTLSLGFAQQIVGPLILDIGVEYNIDKGSKYFGEPISSILELRWQRRSYDLSVYYNPYKGLGGMNIRLNDFTFLGTGLPFVPYDDYELKKE